MSLPGPTATVAVTTQGYPTLERTTPPAKGSHPGCPCTPSAWSRTPPPRMLRPCRIWPRAQQGQGAAQTVGATGVGGDTVSGVAPEGAGVGDTLQ